MGWEVERYVLFLQNVLVRVHITLTLRSTSRDQAGSGQPAQMGPPAQTFSVGRHPQQPHDEKAAGRSQAAIHLEVPSGRADYPERLVHVEHFKLLKQQRKGYQKRYRRGLQSLAENLQVTRAMYCGAESCACSETGALWGQAQVRHSDN